MTNWRETQSSTQAFDKLYHHLSTGVSASPPSVLSETREGNHDFISRRRR